MNVAYFVTGMGRSGTQWLAHLLNKDPDVWCYHEPFTAHDVNAYARIYAGKLDAEEYALQRHKIVIRAIQRRKAKNWAEVNSYLRYMVPALRSEFCCPVAGLARDGRYVVRSLMQRGVYQKPNYPPIKPPKELRDASAFAKCCWYWTDTYERLFDQDVTVFRLEAMNADYGYFAWMCDYLGANVSRPQWEQEAGERMNVSVENTRPPVWSSAQEAAFSEIAGSVMARLGYAW
jgi:hypothetical protein